MKEDKFSNLYLFVVIVNTAIKLFIYTFYVYKKLWKPDPMRIYNIFF